MYGRLFLRLIAATVGKPIITKIKCCVHDGFVYFNGLRQNQEFWYYVFASGQAFFGLGKMGTQLNLNTETIGNITMPVPPLEEQQAIAAFLDRETARIDALIGHKERLIALLEEKRQAVISHAVTRGLDPNAKMKDSGSKFFGQIPERMEYDQAKALKFLVTENYVRNRFARSTTCRPHGVDRIVKGGNCEPGKLKIEGAEQNLS